MQNRRRGLFQRLQGLFQRMIGTGGAVERPSPPVSREEEISGESFQPLPSGPAPLPEQEEQVIVEEETITPGVVGGSNVEYIPGHYTTNRNGGQSVVYGRYRVSDPETGDLEDLMYQPGTSEVTILIVGWTITYAGYAIGKDAASYRVDVSRMQYILEKTPANTIEDAFNEYLAQEGTEWETITEINILNKSDRPY